MVHLEFVNWMWLRKSKKMRGKMKVIVMKSRKDDSDRDEKKPELVKKEIEVRFNTNENT